MAVSGTDLPCGRSLDEVWSGLGRDRDAHEAGCRHCQDARRRLGPLLRLTRSQAERDAADPALQPSEQLTAEVLRIARTELRRGRRLPLLLEPGHDPDSGEEPSLTISEHAVMAVVREAVDRVATRQPDGVAEVRPRGVTVRAPAAGPDEPGSLTVALGVEAVVGTRLPDRLPILRRAVMELVAERTGLRVQSVDVTVEELLDA